MSTGEKNIRAIDFWRWRQRDPNTGASRRTLFGLTHDKSGAFAEARRLADASPCDESEHPEFEDTTPVIGRLEPEKPEE
jgi:hypothetical protein